MQQGADPAGEDCLWVEEGVRCSVGPRCSPQSLQAAMQLVNIQTLAFTPPRTLPWRVFLYTRTSAANTPAATLILGELLYAGEADPKPGAQKGTADEDVELKEDLKARADELERREDEQVTVKVTLKQQPRDDEALSAFLSILTSVLHTLSSERA